MKLTKEQAIDYSIELWEWLAITGLRKEDWPGWGRFGELDEDSDCMEVHCLCFLCQWGKQRAGKVGEDYCNYCPYDKRFGWCCTICAPFGDWINAGQRRTRKKYAQLFLEQLKELKK